MIVFKQDCICNQERVRRINLSLLAASFKLLQDLRTVSYYNLFNFLDTLYIESDSLTQCPKNLTCILINVYGNVLCNIYLFIFIFWSQ